MATRKPWQTLIMLQQKKKDGLMRRLSLLQERLDHAKDLEMRLDHYQNDVTEGFREHARAGAVSVTYLKGAAVFYSRLEDGKAVQVSEVAKLLESIGEVREAIMACDVEIMKYEKLLERDRLEAGRRQAVAEQKATDGFVNAMMARKLLNNNSKGT